MIYIKRLLKAEVGEKPRNIGLKNDIAESFFHLKIGSSKQLSFKYIDESVLCGDLTSVTGNNPQITGDLFSFVKNNATLNDLLVFISTEDDTLFEFKIIKQTDSLYDKYNWLMDEYGSKYGSTSTHLLITTDDTEDKQSGDFPLQRILYGAPGTGKSFSVFEAIAIHSGIIKEGEKLSKEQRKALEESKNVFRTTFHPDYDYAQFVGCYKPTKSSNRILSQAELVKVFNDMDMAETYPLSKIGYQYWESFEKIDASEFLKACGKESQAQELGNGIELGKKFRKDTDKITYEFVPQVFTQALIKSYETSDPVYLVIEEINRGNCAQIFGDIFQLLDRKSEGDFKGESEYSINVDEDLRKYLEEKCPAAIKDGKIKLPRNFNIIATMNTSDQSLFPMDSAFKRRWDWKYVPINTKKKNWQIECNGSFYSWSSFLEKINKEIGDTTSSEDKKLGFFFCKADKKANEADEEPSIISADRFTSKALFYIYNDVFKDYGFDEDFFKGKKDDNTNDASIIAFESLFDEEGNVKESAVQSLLDNLSVEKVKNAALNNVEEDDEYEEEDEDGNTQSSTTRDYTKFSINGEGNIVKRNLATECVKKYIQLNPTMSPDEVCKKWASLDIKVSHFIETKEQFEGRTDISKRSNEVPCGDTTLYVGFDGYVSEIADDLMNAVNARDWGIKIEKL